ncbi:hypothetical protein M0Q28_01025 [Patescibacteria group bacterium]|jgi:hypothetical protein|nr:hypothetical protein [Patescibacteria group bacterium]
MSARTVKEIMDALWSISSWDNDASALVERFRREAEFPDWDESRPLPSSNEFIDFASRSVEPGDVVVFRACGASRARKSPIAWCAYGRNVYDGQEYRLIFVDAQPCHPDWLGFKLFSEIASLYGHIHMEEIVAAMAHVLPPLDDDALQDLLQPALTHLDNQRWAMLYRLVDHRMYGRLSQTVRSMRQRRFLHTDFNEMVLSLSTDVCRQHRTTWADPLNADERRVRNEVTRCATIGAVKNLLGSLPTQH